MRFGPVASNEDKKTPWKCHGFFMQSYIFSNKKGRLRPLSPPFYYPWSENYILRLISSIIAMKSASLGSAGLIVSVNSVI